LYAKQYGFRKQLIKGWEKKRAPIGALKIKKKRLIVFYFFTGKIGKIVFPCTSFSTSARPR
jgi:hypothetical protein